MFSPLSHLTVATVLQVRVGRRRIVGSGSSHGFMTMWGSLLLSIVSSAYRSLGGSDDGEGQNR